MATLNDLATAVSSLTTQVTRVEQLVADLHAQQGVPEADLDPILAGINDATARLTALS